MNAPRICSLNLRTIARLCALLKASSGEQDWKVIHDKLRRTYYLSRADHVRKIKNSRQRPDIGKYSFVNMTIKNRDHLLADVLGTSPLNPKIFRN